MICVNELSALKCNNREVLEPLLIVLSPYAPHISEELWELLGHEQSIIHAQFPIAEEKYLTEDSHQYPVSINGKMRAKIELSLSLSKQEIEEAALQDEQIQKWTKGQQPKKVIVVPGKIVNIVL